eukprot:SAG22_NODE_979_length_6186_cov_10.777887_6_plen_69_part_00
MPPAMEAAYHFVAPSTDNYNFAMTAVDAHFYSLTNGKKANVDRQSAPDCATTVTLHRTAGIKDHLPTW